MQRRAILMCEFVTVSLTGLLCAGAAAANTAGALQPSVIYGDDNRHELYEIAHLPEVLRVADASVALIRDHYVYYDPARTIARLLTEPYGAEGGLCRDEPYYGQPVTPFCSGALIAPDLVLTAGHCVLKQMECESVSVAFGFALQQPGKYPYSLPANEVYKCKRLRAHHYDQNGIDYAVIQLDRPVSGHLPLGINLTTAPQAGEALLVSGHPMGLPLKIADGAEILAVGESTFESNVDTYAGSSGSPVVSASTGMISGVLVRGARDFVVRPGEGCMVSRRCTQAGCADDEKGPTKEVATSTYAIRSILAPLLGQ